MSKRLKIGYVTSSISYHGGWDTLSKGIVTAVSKHHAVVVLAARGEANDTMTYPIHSVLPAHYFNFGLPNQLRTTWQCLRYFRNVDLIHALIEPLAPGAAFASFILRKPFAITLAGTYCVIPEGKSFRNIVKRWLMKFMYRRAKFIATGSLKNIELIERVLPLGDRWQFVPFGVDLEKYPLSTAYTPAIPPFLLTVGAVKPRKGADYVIRALASLKSELPNLRYKIAGGYRQGLGFVEELKRLIAEHKLEDRVELLGRVSDADLNKLYQTCTAFLLAAQTKDGAFEGFPMVFYEAQALGAPVISTSGFGSEYVIKHGSNGFLVSQDNVAELADAIKKLVTDDALAHSMSERGRIEAQRHTWDHIVGHYLEAYTKLTKHA